MWSASRRFVRLTEEVDFGATSSLSGHVHPYGTFGIRLASRRTGPDQVGLGRRTRTAQLITPLLLDGRFSYSADQDLNTVIDWAAASRALLDTIFQRKSDYAGVSSHSQAALGDLRSWNLELLGPNPKESQRARGCKARSFLIATRQGGRPGQNRPIFLQVQYLVDNQEEATYPGQLPQLELFPRRAPAPFSLGASRIRINPAATSIGTDLGGEILHDPEGFSIRCNRQISGMQNPTGGVDGSQAAIGDEPILGPDERWSVRIEAPVFDNSEHGKAQALVDAYWSEDVSHSRWNIRFDLGSSNKTLYVPITDAGNAVAIPFLLPQTPFIAPGPGVAEGLANPSSTSQLFAVYGLETNPGTGVQFKPKAGDTIRYIGRRGPPNAEQELAYGGYVLKVGAGLTLVDGVFSDFGFPGMNPISILNALTGITGSPVLPAGFPTPQILMLMFFTGYLHTPVPSTHEYLVPGGMAIELRNVALSACEGLRPNDASYAFTFESDAQSEVVVTY